LHRLFPAALAAILFCGTLVWAETGSTLLPPVQDTEVVAEKQAGPSGGEVVGNGESKEEQNPDLRYQVGSLRVVVYDGGRPDKTADVFFNGRRLGNAPSLVEGMRPGEYQVKVTAQKRSWSGTVKIEAGKITAVDVIFEKETVKAEIYEALLWEDFLDNRNNWTLKQGSLIHDGRFLAKTHRFLDYYIGRNLTVQDFTLEAAVRLKRENRLFAKDNNFTENTFGLAFRVKGSATVLLLQLKGKSIRNYYLLNFDDIEYYSNPIISTGELKVPIDEWFRFKVTLRQDELQVFINGKLVAITQVKYVNEGNIGLVAGPGVTLEVEHLTVGII